MTDKMKHTPGPWFVPYRSHGALYVEAHLRPGWLQEVAACGPTEVPEQQEANTRLIAAAPELLEFVAEYMDIYEAASSAQTDDLVQHIVAQQERMKALYLRARALHAKATGEF